MSVEVRIEGLAELDAKLAELTNAVAGKVLHQALMFASTPMLKEAKSKAPATALPYKRYASNAKGGKRAKRGEGQYVVQQAGLLKKHIRRTKMKLKTNGAGIGIYVSQKGGTGKVPFYWHMIEYGTSKMQAQPFLRPAFHNNKEVSVTRFGEKLKQAIDKVAQG